METEKKTRLYKIVDPGNETNQAIQAEFFP
uniref:Uncharacterized protein n=1 Tax=Rhizophora mucronata TaxID=61149 RepID=A0A2P2N1U5_RHIMU